MIGPDALTYKGKVNIAQPLIVRVTGAILLTRNREDGGVEVCVK